MKTSEVYTSAEYLCSMYTNYSDKVFISECFNFQSLENPPKSIIEMSIKLKQNDFVCLHVHRQLIEQLSGHFKHFPELCHTSGKHTCR